MPTMAMALKSSRLKAKMTLETKTLKPALKKLSELRSKFSRPRSRSQRMRALMEKFWQSSKKPSSELPWPWSPREMHEPRCSIIAKTASTTLLRLPQVLAALLANMPLQPIARRLASILASTVENPATGPGMKNARSRALAFSSHRKARARASDQNAT